jgi:hypothetical protein
MVLVQEVTERAHDPKVAETRLAIPSDQDVVLVAPTVNMRACSFPQFTYRSDATMQNL